ncbi:MAG: phosphotransferase family protein [Silicimonas sp.]|nr:phosphotransferase family protein [Silicimonas sp.]
MTNEIENLVAGLPMLQGIGARAERLGGLTNRVYRYGPFVLRFPGEGTEEYINREHEAMAARIAATAGVSPDILHVDPLSGIMVTRFVDGAATMSPEAFRERRGSPARAGKAFASLHAADEPFPFTFELFSMIDNYLGLLAGKDVELPAGYHDVVTEAECVRSALAARPLPSVPCHCDPLCENFLDTGERMWIVDWEYAGMNDPMWDLGDLSVEAGFSEDQDMEMLTAYFDDDPSPENHGRMVVYKAMCDLLWTLWGLIQLANGNPADDFRAYADGRFARCMSLMASPGFSRHLAAIS